MKQETPEQMLRRVLAERYPSPLALAMREGMEKMREGFSAFAASAAAFGEVVRRMTPKPVDPVVRKVLDDLYPREGRV